jgi:dihydrodipicolinate synthase/N-acetylneuraminate lyase
MFGSLTYPEVKDLTRVMVEAAGGRALTIAATGVWDREQVLDYARFSESVGADAIQVLAPRGAGDDDVVAFFQDHARNTRLAIVLHGHFSMPLLRRLLAVDAIVAMKDEDSLSEAIEHQIAFGQRMVAFPANNSPFVVCSLFGARAYYCELYQVWPDVGLDFWRAMQKGDVRRAAAIIKKYDHPFLRRWSHPFWRACMEHFGAAQRYLRPPDRSYTDAEMREVERYWDGLGITPKRRVDSSAPPGGHR